MRVLYVLAVLTPPVAVALAGSRRQAALNALLTTLMWLPGVVHALLVVSAHYAGGAFKTLAGDDE